VPVKQEEKNTVEPVAKASAPVERKDNVGLSEETKRKIALQGGAPTK